MPIIANPAAGPAARSRQQHDVVVVGGRAAGAATALLLARMGHDVAVVERAVLPADTLSTHLLTEPGVVQLARWGLLDSVLASGAPALRQVTRTAAGATVTLQVEHTDGLDLLVAPRRYVLDTLVADAAAAAGATVHLGVTVTGVQRDGTGRVTGVVGRDRDGRAVDLRARVVVGADGLGSRIARAVDAEVVDDRGGDGATQYAYYAGLPWPGIELVVADRAFAGVFPTHGGEACIWICTPSADVRAARRTAGSRSELFEGQLLKAAPELAERLRRAERVSPVRGMLHMPNVVRRAAGPGWALVGDAGYHRDAVTGHGMSDAYRDAELLAVALDALLRGDAGEDEALRDYASRRDEALRPVLDITSRLAAYPPVDQFLELQKQLGAAMDAEAAALAARPVPGGAVLAVA